MKGTLTELLARVEAAVGPDRELDLAIGIEFGEADHSGPAYHRPFKDWARHYTASIDAALALVEKMLPGWNIKLEIFPKGTNLAQATIKRYVNHELEYYLSWSEDFVARPPAIAILAALLRALSSREKGDG